MLREKAAGAAWTVPAIVGGLLFLVWQFDSFFGAVWDPETERLRGLPYAELRDAAESIPYNDLYRNAESHKGELLVYVGRLAHVSGSPEEGFFMRAQVTPPDSDFVLWDDVIALNYTGERFREDDIIERVGTSRGLMTYEALLGNEVTVPNIDVMQARFLRRDD